MPTARLACDVDMTEEAELQSRPTIKRTLMLGDRDRLEPREALRDDPTHG